MAGSSESREPLKVSDGIRTGGSLRHGGPVHPVIPRQGKATSLKLLRVQGAEQGIHGRGRERVTGLSGRETVVTKPLQCSVGEEGTVVTCLGGEQLGGKVKSAQGSQQGRGGGGSWT